MILLLATLAHAACVTVPPEIWPPAGADAPRNVGVRAALDGRDCVPDALVVELRGPTRVTASAEVIGLLVLFEDLPDLEPGNYEVTVRDPARTFQVRSDFVVSDRYAAPPEPPAVTSVSLTRFGEEDGVLTADVGLDRLPAGHAASIEWDFPDERSGPGFIIERDPTQPATNLWRSIDLAVLPLEETCIDVVTLSESREAVRTEFCTVPVAMLGMPTGCSATPTTPAWLLLLAASLGLAVRRRRA